MAEAAALFPLGICLPSRSQFTCGQLRFRYVDPVARRRSPGICTPLALAPGCHAIALMGSGAHALHIPFGLIVLASPI